MAYEEATEADRGLKIPKADLVKWKTMIRLAENYQKKKGNFPSGTGLTEGRWDVNIKALDGDFNSYMELGPEAIDVNVTHATIQTLLSPLWTTLPYITVRPTTEKYEDGDQVVDNVLRAELTEYEINYWMRELNVNRVVKKSILDCAATNCGYVYIGYVADKSEIENSEGEATENEPQIRLKSPFVKRISPKKILIPAGYYEIEECPWVAIGFLKPCRDVKDKYDVKELKGDVMGMSDEDIKAMDLTPEMGEYLRDEDSGYVMLWQIWDKREHKLISLTMNHDDALDCEDWPYDLEGFPLSKLRFTWTPDQQFGMPMMTAWIAQQKELNGARTTTGKREARTKSGYFVLNAPEGLIDEYKKAPDGFIIDVKVDTDDIRKVMQPDVGLPPAVSAYNYGATQISDLFMISGLGQQQRGAGDPNIDSATASALVDKWAMIRQTDMGDSVRTHYLEIAKKIWMLLKQFPNTKRDMLVMGRKGSLQRVSYTLAELKGEFAFTMDLSAMYSEDPVTKQRNAMARYNLMRADPLVRGERLVSDVLASGNIFNLQSYMTTLKSPDEEFTGMLQGLPVQANELDDHMGHVTEHDKQADQLEQLINTTQEGSPENTKARTAMNLLIAHVNDHARIMAMFDSKNAKKAGEPVAENMMREQTAAPGAGETQAEMSGGPVGGPPESASPGGVAAV